MLGKPLMPWQQYVADVILEIDPDTGRLAYTEVGLTVPRQSGKSTFILAKSTHRASATKFFGPRQRLVYTAQTRQKAREKWEEDYAADLETSKVFGPKVNVHKGNGNEHIRFPNGSRFGIEANTEKAGHGGTLDEAYIDEAFAQPDNRLEQAFRPAMITRRNKQLMWVSTAGWLLGSPYLEEKTNLGRAAVEAGVTKGVAYFEWSAPEDADPSDPAVWRACMPALGHTVDEDAIAGEFAGMKLNDFRRAYLNMWVPKSVEDRVPVFGEGMWEQIVAEPEDSEIVEALHFGVAVSIDRAWSCIGVAGRRSDGRIALEVIDHKRGTAWLVDRVGELQERHGRRPVILDGRGPASSLQPDFDKAGIDVSVAGTNDVVNACASLYDEVQKGGVTHMAQPELDAAVAGAQKRPVGDRWAWGRKVSADICPLEAVTLAAWGVTEQDEGVILW